MQGSNRRWLFLLGIAAGVLFTVPLYIDYSTKSYILSSIEAAPSSTVVIVLGASVIKGEPSPVLQERAEAAFDLYHSGKVQKVLVTGDDSVPGFDEVTPVRKYLLDAGVAPEDIFLDHAGFDTYSSMYRAKEIFGVTDAIIVTQSFHMPRSVFIARTLGIEAYGIVAEERGDPIYNYSREWLASIKAAGDLLFKRIPTYMGEQFPIEGDGQGTWE
ncbi:MAG: YdcF family protein [Candidatus Pacebacteria bacterium]|nr:YdcF family protein [Candidatus Paceibacterota bacterium]